MSPDEPMVAEAEMCYIGCCDLRFEKIASSGWLWTALFTFTE